MREGKIDKILSVLFDRHIFLLLKTYDVLLGNDPKETSVTSNESRP